MHNTGLSVNSLVHKNYFKTKLLGNLGELILASKPKDSSQKSLLSEIILKNQVFKILLASLFLRLTKQLPEVFATFTEKHLCKSVFFM